MNAPRPPIRLLIVDDHPVVRDGLRRMLSDEDIDVVGETGSGTQALELATATTPDVVLLDMMLPDVDGLVVLQRLRSVAPQTAVLVFSMHDEPALVRRAVNAGAAGYVLKGAGRRELISSVQAVSAGKTVLDPSVLQAMLAETTAASPGSAAEGPRAQPILTAVELDVLRLVANGLTNREISERLRWSVGTSKKYVQRILEKLNVSDRTQAAIVAFRQGLLR